MNSLIKNETWSLVEPPPGRAPIKNRWVFKIKRSGQKNVKFKARLVAKGFSQRPGLDYGETYSPVVKHDSLRTILSLAAAHELELLQLDVKTAFVNGDIDEELYMDQPIGFKEDSQLVCLLKKGLHGLKQASRAWNDKFNHFLNSIWFYQKQCRLLCLFPKGRKQHHHNGNMGRRWTTLQQSPIKTGRHCQLSLRQVRDYLWTCGPLCRFGDF